MKQILQIGSNTLTQKESLLNRKKAIVASNFLKFLAAILSNYLLLHCKSKHFSSTFLCAQHLYTLPLSSPLADYFQLKYCKPLLVYRLLECPKSQRYQSIYDRFKSCFNKNNQKLFSNNATLDTISFGKFSHISLICEAAYSA